MKAKTLPRAAIVGLCLAAFIPASAHAQSEQPHPCDHPLGKPTCDAVDRLLADGSPIVVEPSQPVATDLGKTVSCSANRAACGDDSDGV